MTAPSNILEQLAEQNPKALTIDGHDSALMGIGGQFGKSLAVYSEEIIIRNLMEQDMTLVESVEYFHFNIAGAWLGENTPIIVDFANIRPPERLGEATEEHGEGNASH